MALRFDPKTGRVIVGDLTPSIKGNLATLQDYADDTLTSNKEQAELLLNLAEINEKLELLMGSTPVVKFKDKDNDTRTLDEMLFPQDFALEVVRGNILGVTCVNKFGEAPAGVQTTATDIWDRADATPTQQIWVAPTQARTHTIASTDANDTGGGTGARTVMVWGLPSWDAKEINETLTMNTGSPPVTANSYVIIHRMRVLTSGATSVNIGTITATATTDGTVTAAIRPLEGTTHMAIYGIPSSQTAYLVRWYGSINKASGAAGTINFKLVSNEEPQSQLTNFSVRSERGVQSTGTSDIDWHLPLPLKLNGPCLLKIQGIASAADIDSSAGFDLYIVDNKI